MLRISLCFQQYQSLIYHSILFKRQQYVKRKIGTPSHMTRALLDEIRDVIYVLRSWLTPALQVKSRIRWNGEFCHKRIQDNHPTSNLRPTIRECVHLVFISSHVSKRSANHWIRHSRKPHATCKLHRSMLYRTRLLPIEVLHRGNKEFQLSLFMDLDIGPMTFIYELYRIPCILKIYRMSENELSTSRLSKVIVWQTDKQTDRQTRQKLYTTPLCGWSINGWLLFHHYMLSRMLLALALSANGVLYGWYNKLVFCMLICFTEFSVSLYCSVHRGCIRSSAA